MNYEKLTKDEKTHIVNTYILLIVHSPRSLEICKQEGVKPSSLLYRPLEFFSAPGKPKSIQHQEYELFNNQRIGIIKQIT